jgi:hypothetical protein
MANTRYVNTASSPGGNGTTNATVGANRAYASLGEWEAARQAVLADVEIVICEGATADTTGVTIDGWTTTSTNYIEIKTDAAGRHDGKRNTSKYRLDTTSRCIDIVEDFVRIDGLQFQITTSVGTQGIRSQAGASADIRISNCIFKGVISGTSEVDGVLHTVGTLRMRNCIFYDFVNGANFMGALYLGGSHAASYIYNCTFQNCYFGLNNDAGTVCTVKNTMAQDCTSYSFGGTYNAASTNNCYDSGSGAAPGSNSQTGEVTFVNEASDDFHIDSSDTVAKNNGADLSADANYAFSDDIDGASRSGTWDIGADEITTASGAMSGSTTLTFSPSGALTGAGALSGSSTLTFSPTATLTGAGALSGSTTLTFTVSGATGGGSSISGSTSLSFTPSGTLTGSGALSGSASLTFTPSATLAGTAALSGSTALTFAVSGSGQIAGTVQASGATSLTFTASGTLTGTSSEAPIYYSTGQLSSFWYL